MLIRTFYRLVPMLLWSFSMAATGQSILVAGTEAIAGSSIPVTYHLVETDDGLFVPIGLRRPAGDGPFPVVLMASGNGGGGLDFVKEVSHSHSWTPEQFLVAGYAVAWLRFRSEVEANFYDDRPLTTHDSSASPVYDRAPLDFEDVIAVIEYVKTLSYIDSENVGYLGMSHSGEMLLSIASVYDGLAAGIASEPATATLLARRAQSGPVASVPETAARYDEDSLNAAVIQLHARIDRQLALPRLQSITTPLLIQGRHRDHNQALFRVTFELLTELGKAVEWKSYDHDSHGFIYVQRNRDGDYVPNTAQKQAVSDFIAFFDQHLK